MGCRVPIAADEAAAVWVDPASLPRAFPLGGAAMAWRARELATSGPLGLLGVRRAIGWASAAQKEAIGAGLAKAAAACAGREGSVTTAILDMLRGIGDLEVVRTFAKVLVDSSTTSAPFGPDPADAGSGRLPLSGALGDAAHYFISPLDRKLGIEGP